VNNIDSSRLTLLEDNGNRLVYELPITEVQLADEEQLDELKKSHPLFFTCINFTVKANSILFFYQKEEEYLPLTEAKLQNRSLLKLVAFELLKLEHLIGTQYTTVLHPANIFVNSSGKLKLAHRGIRNVFPTQGLSRAKLVKEIRELLIYLFSDFTYDEVKQGLEQTKLHDTMIAQLANSKTLDELKEAVEQIEDTPETAEKKKDEKKQLKTGSTKEKTKKPVHRSSLLTGALAGLLIGLLVMYLFQVVPLTNTYSDEVTAAEQKRTEETSELETEKEEIETNYEETLNLLEAYRAYTHGEPALAVANLESASELEESEIAVLSELYFKEGSLESLLKALELGKDYEVRAIQALANMGTDEGDEAVISFTSENNAVLLEQAFIEEEYETVVELAEQLDTDRAKRLAARSHLELENPEEALTLGEELESTELQLASLQLEYNLIEENEDEDDEEATERLEEIEEAIEELE
jgi:uncharacterized membrane protein YukC